MDENNNEHREEHVHNKNDDHHDGHHSDCWLKYLAVALASFLGAFLAVYIVLDRTIAKHMNPYHHFPGFHKEHQMFMNKKFKDTKDIDKYIEENEELSNDITKFEESVNPFAVSPVKVQTFKENNTYKIVIDLRPFDGDSDNINVDIKPRKIKLSGESDMTSKDGSENIVFMQNFSLPKKIDVNHVTKEIKDGNYIITLPIAD